MCCLGGGSASTTKSTWESIETKEIGPKWKLISRHSININNHNNNNHCLTQPRTVVSRRNTDFHPGSNGTNETETTPLSLKRMAVNGQTREHTNSTALSASSPLQNSLTTSMHSEDVTTSLGGLFLTRDRDDTSMESVIVSGEHRRVRRSVFV